MSKRRGPVDLHVHSNASDGLLAPAEVIRSAARAGLSAVALTDHDTMMGMSEAEAAGRSCGIEVVPGVEISAYEAGREIHLLGYYPADRKKLAASLAAVRRERYRRMEAILDRLDNLDIRIPHAAVNAEAGRAAPGRLHLARLMVKEKIVQNPDEAFSLYLAKGKPAFVPRTGFDAVEALAVLLEAGSVPVLAHPGLHGGDYLKKLVPLGLRGVEVFHPEHNAALQQYYRGRAASMGLLVTGGSDFHGDREKYHRQPDFALIPYRCLDKLKAASRAKKVFSQ